jgi:hypothetical protein
MSESIKNLTERSLKDLNDYSIARPALMRHSLSLRDLPGGPWRARAVRETGEGRLSITGIATQKKEGTAFEGVGIFRDSNLDAPYKDFHLIDDSGLPPAAESDAAIAAHRYEFWLGAVRTAACSLRRLLPILEQIEVGGVNTESVTRFRQAIPAFPYVPTSHSVKEGEFLFEGATARVEIEIKQTDTPPTKWEGVIEREQYLIEEARLTLNRLIVRSQAICLPVGSVYAPLAADAGPRGEG